MSHIRITIDDEVVMDADPGQWSVTPPDVASLQLKGGGTTPKPWMQAVLLTLASVATLAMAGKPAGDTVITVTTRDGGWTLDVHE